MTRPDLPVGFGGWQVVDSTPQENSDGKAASVPEGTVTAVLLLPCALGGRSPIRPSLLGSGRTSCLRVARHCLSVLGFPLVLL